MSLHLISGEVVEVEEGVWSLEWDEVIMNMYLIAAEVVVEEEVGSLSLLQDRNVMISLHLIAGKEVEVVWPLKQEQVLYLTEKEVWSLKCKHVMMNLNSISMEEVEVEVVEEEV